MIRILFFTFFLFCLCFGAIGENKVWQRGYTFLDFLADNHIPLRLYYNLPAADKELTAEIRAGIEYQILKDRDGKLIQALIPIDEEVQIHIQRDDFQYKLSLIGIKTFERQHVIALEVSNSPHQDIFSFSKDLGLANEFLNTYRNSINFKREVIKGDKLAIVYIRKYRFGHLFGTPTIKATMIETNKKSNYLIAYNDGRFYNLQGKEIAGFLLQMPLNSVYITSRFSRARKHPVLKTIVRPHFGIDFRARIGTPVYAAGNGKVVSAGWKGGYGKAVEILHEGGLKTLYAHLSKVDSRIRVGSYVRQGRMIGRSGNTGLSSGPHLHFGLYKNNRPIDPLGSIKTTRSELRGKKRKEFFEIANRYKQQIQEELDQLDGRTKHIQVQGTLSNDSLGND